MIKPNLPTNIVNNVIISCEISKKIEYSLNSYGINVTKLYGNYNVSKPIINHPDLYISHFDEEKIFSINEVYELNGNIDISDYLHSIRVNNPTTSVYYPQDAVLNCVALNNCLICNTKVVSKQILNYAINQNYKIIDVKQGYTKCNICIVNENSIITEDVGIYKTLTKYGFNVLLLKKKAVHLNGYAYGFIGGASGKISADKLCFCGNILVHPEYSEIYKFLYKQGIEPISLSDEVLYDFGSIIPL